MRSSLSLITRIKKSAPFYTAKYVYGKRIGYIINNECMYVCILYVLKSDHQWN